tara:strand:+ start:3049 stop:3552 length:504 start_codon:yes stop_codon:yes gene_type:complete
MGLTQDLSGQIAINSTNYDPDTKTSTITKEHQALRNHFKITHPYPNFGGPLILLPVGHWSNFWMLHSWVCKTNGDAPDSGAKVDIMLSDLEILRTDLEHVIKLPLQEETFEILDDIFQSDAESFSHQDYKDNWNDIKELASDLAKLIDAENDPNTQSFQYFCYEGWY